MGFAGRFSPRRGKRTACRLLRHSAWERSSRRTSKTCNRDWAIHPSQRWPLHSVALRTMGLASTPLKKRIGRREFPSPIRPVLAGACSKGFSAKTTRPCSGVMPSDVDPAECPRLHREPRQRFDVTARSVRRQQNAHLVGFGAVRRLRPGPRTCRPSRTRGRRGTAASPVLRPRRAVPASGYPNSPASPRG